MLLLRQEIVELLLENRDIGSAKQVELKLPSKSTRGGTKSF
jgi:hypothetical protein